MHKLEDWQLGWDGTMSLEDYIFLLFEFQQKEALLQIVEKKIYSKKKMSALWKKFQKLQQVKKV